MYLTSNHRGLKVWWTSSSTCFILQFKLDNKKVAFSTLNLKPKTCCSCRILLALCSNKILSLENPPASVFKKSNNFLFKTTSWIQYFKVSLVYTLKSFGGVPLGEPSLSPHTLILCPPSLDGLSNLDKTKVSKTLDSCHKSVFVNLFITGISNPIILWPISLSAFCKKAKPSCTLPSNISKVYWVLFSSIATIQ